MDKKAEEYWNKFMATGAPCYYIEYCTELKNSLAKENENAHKDEGSCNTGEKT